MEHGGQTGQGGRLKLGNTMEEVRQAVVEAAVTGVKQSWFQILAPSLIGI